MAKPRDHRECQQSALGLHDEGSRRDGRCTWCGQKFEPAACRPAPPRHATSEVAAAYRATPSIPIGATTAMTRRPVVPLSNPDAKRAVAIFGRSPRVPAVPLLPPNPPEDVWLTTRRRDGDTWRIGASELAAVLGISPFASPFSLWWAKQDDWQTEQTDAMKIGHKLEDTIGELFAEERPDLMVCRSNAGLWGHPVHDWMVCTPDFLAVAGDLPTCPQEDVPGGSDVISMRRSVDVRVEPVECKSDEGGTGWGTPGSGDVPAHHRVQLLVQCAIFDAPRGHLVRLAGKRFTRYVVEYDDAARADLEQWVKAGEAFVADLVAGVSPDIDGHDATQDTLIRLHPAVDEGTTEMLPVDLAEAYERLHGELDAAKARYAEVCNRVRDRMGRAQYAVDPDGRRIAQRLVFKRRGYEVAPGQVDMLRRKAK